MTLEDDGGPSNGNPSGFIRGLLGEETGPTQGLREYREAGGEIRDSRWFSLYGQVQSTYAARPDQLGLDPYSIPGPESYETWELGKGGQYATQVQVQVYDRDTGEFLTKQYTYVTDVPHSAAEAEENAFSEFGDPEVESDYGETVMGALAVTYAVTIPYGAGG